MLELKESFLSVNRIITIESATVADIAGLCDLLALLFSQEIEFQPNRTAQEIGLRAILHDPNSGIILVARKAGNIIGMVSLLFTVSTVLGGRVALLEDMIVLPTERGTGIGSALLNAAIQAASENACKRITLLTDSNNATAQQFYKKQGFTPSQMLALRLILA
jgi:GNAT superfamily N-acetyltransferase